MRKTIKSFICFMLAVSMFAASLMISDTKAFASSAAAKMSIWVKSQSSMYVELASGDYKIANLKSSKSNLIVRTTHVNSGSDYSGSATISMYAKKKGTYTVTFDVVDQYNKKRQSHTVKVFAHNEPAIKQATFNGSEVYGIVSSKPSGKFKVKMNKGYKLKSITMNTYDKNGKEISKTIKNGRKVKLGKYRHKYEGSKSKDYEWWSADLLARTSFRITYIDKYTKEEDTSYYSVYRIPSN